jgi:hypothetical protein
MMEEATITKKIEFEKVLLGIIAILLFILVVMQFYQPGPSAECLEARTNAVSLGNSSLYFLDSYEDMVYGSQVENINQQIFLVNEYQYLATEKLLLYQQAILEIATECEW